MSSRRIVLGELRHETTTNAGLWLDKYIKSQARDETSARGELVEQVASIREPKGYRKWFDLWKNSLDKCEAQCREAETLGRLAIGLGGTSVLETSATLHHTFGVPFIPGTALKGLAANYTRQYLGREWVKDSIPYEILFGSTENAGHVHFFDALPLPGKNHVLPDILTVHHGPYYKNEKNAPPADWDQPTPVPFLSVQGTFLCALSGPQEWVDAAFNILTLALFNLGIGAKTSSGYGRMELRGLPEDPEQIRTKQLILEVEAIPVRQIAGSIHGHYESWRDSNLPIKYKVQFAAAIIGKADSSGSRNIKKKSWYRELKNYIKEHSHE